MPHQLARRRFTRVLIGAMLVFVLASMGLAWAERALALPAFLPWLLVLLPVLALLTPLWAQWRYLHEIDEYLRSLELKAIFFGLALVLTLASGWGYAEMYVEGPRVPIYWLNPVYWVAYSAATVFLGYREGQQA